MIKQNEIKVLLMAKVHGGNLHHIYADGCIPERQHFERSKKVVLPN
jgi:hypothetical protein